MLTFVFILNFCLSIFKLEIRGLKSEGTSAYKPNIFLNSIILLKFEIINFSFDFNLVFVIRLIIHFLLLILNLHLSISFR